MSFTDKALQAHMKSALHAGIEGLNEKIADITHADTNKHTITLATLGIPENAVALILAAARSSGTGKLSAFPIEGTFGVCISDAIATSVLETRVIAITNGRLQYSLSVANDDFDLYCFGYQTKGQVLG